MDPPELFPVERAKHLLNIWILKSLLGVVKDQSFDAVFGIISSGMYLGQLIDLKWPHQSWLSCINQVKLIASQPHAAYAEHMELMQMAHAFQSLKNISREQTTRYLFIPGHQQIHLS